MKNDLKNLSDPNKNQNLILLKKFDSKKLIKILTEMIIIRKTENKLAWAKKNQLIVGPVHLGVGQEAIAVGVSQNLTERDYVFGNHRSHSHLLALNPNFYKLFAEVLGKKTGFSKGMGGSMHLHDKASGFYGSVPIVAGTVPLAVGAALSAKFQKKKNVSVTYIGDGAIEEGVVHESLNLAKIQKAPVLFVVENNLFASHMHISERQPSNSILRFAKANNIRHKLVDGNDILSVIDASQKLIKDLREDKGPALIEFVTYRWYGHVDWRDDIDVGVERSLKDVQNWKKRDPILRLSKSMIKSGIWNEIKEKTLKEKINKKIKCAWIKAMNDPYPPKKNILNFVYSRGLNGKN